MKLWCSLFVVALLFSSSASGGGRAVSLLDKFGRVAASKSGGLVSKAAGVLAAGVIACTGLSCDTNTVIRVAGQTTQHTEATVQVNYALQRMYYVIDGIAWPYHAVDVPDYGYPEVVDRDCNYVPMDVMYGTDVPDHEYVGADVAYLSPPYEGGDPYYHYGKVIGYYGSGFYEVEVLSWSVTYTYTERTTLNHSYTVLIDSTLNADDGGIVLDIGELE